MSKSNPFADLSDEQLRILHGQSESFENSLRSSRAVTIETFLESAPQEFQSILFCELLAIELEWSRSRSTPPNVDDYLQRFPDRAPEIQAAFLELHRSSQANDVSDDSQSIRLPRVTLPQAGTVIDGRYTVIEPIGEGGMGSVFLAQQHRPVERLVAIKFIKGGTDTRQVLNRFDTERRTLALMDHPGIARVYDGGQTEDGSPYFVMELVRGITITCYCDEHGLDIPARLKLFVSICQAVQHAHSKGIIHRDLKPGNILVTEIDDHPNVKVIDFGVAKATDQQRAEQTLAATAMIIGTPAYMSPEQADPTSPDIDTRTDVYSLGVLLFELLVGSPPHDVKGLPNAPIFELLRRIREIDSPRPSSKVSSIASLPEIAANRGIDPERLAPSLRGELDWIALKALERDRERRYETVNGLARDVERYLAGELVEARPPSNLYRLQKFAKRYSIQVIAAGVLVATLLAGILGTTWGFLAARKEVIAKEIALDNESRERKFAEAISEFVESDFLALTSLEGRLGLGDESSKLNKDSSLHDLLDRAAEKLKQRSDMAPRIQAKLQLIIGRSYLHLREFPQAIAAFESSVAFYNQTYGENDEATLAAEEGLAEAWQENGQTDLAFPLLTKIIEIKTAQLGDDHTETIQLRRLLADNYRRSGKPKEALLMVEEAVSALKKKLPPNDPIVLSTMYQLALTLNDADQPARAMPLLEDTLEKQVSVFGQNHPNVAVIQEKLAGLYMKFGNYEKSKPLLEDSLLWTVQNYGENSMHTVYTRASLVRLYLNSGEQPQALKLAQKNVDLTKQLLGSSHPDFANAASDLAMCFRAAGQHIEALGLFDESLRIRREALGEDHPNTLTALANVAASLRSLGRLDESQEINEKCLELATRILGSDHSKTVSIKQNLAAGYWSTQQLDRSVPLFEEVLNFWEKRAGRDHPNTLLALANVGINYRDAGRTDEAIPLLEEVYQAIPRMPTLRFVRLELLNAYLKGGRIEQVENLLVPVVEEARRRFPPKSQKLVNELLRISRVLIRSKRWSDAEELLRECTRIEEELAVNSWVAIDCDASLAECLLRQGNYDEAETLLISAAYEMLQAVDDLPKNADSRRMHVIDLVIETATHLKHTDIVTDWQKEKENLAGSATAIVD